MLLAAFDERRPTRDVDLLGLAITNDADSITAVVAEIAAIEVDDGVVFRPDQLTTRLIREQDVYAAVAWRCPPGRDRRGRAEGRRQRRRPGHPGPVEMTYPALLDEPFTMVGYPLETVLARSSSP
jgi:hypothetical protein